MPRTRYLTLRCGHAGCRETGSGGYDNQREAAEWRAKSWRCWRHTAPDEMLTPQRPCRTTTWVNVESDGHNYFGPDGGYASAGAISGPGFRLKAADFPAGSRLVVSVQVLPPIDADEDAPDVAADAR